MLWLFLFSNIGVPYLFSFLNSPIAFIFWLLVADSLEQPFHLGKTSGDGSNAKDKDSNIFYKNLSLPWNFSSWHSINLYHQYFLVKIESVI